MFEITEKRKTENGTETFGFIANSTSKGVEVALVSYTLKERNKIIKRWANYGNDGSFCKRREIEIPTQVLNSARSKILESITFKAEQ